RSISYVLNATRGKRCQGITYPLSHHFATPLTFAVLASYTEGVAKNGVMDTLVIDINWQFYAFARVYDG
ncbi:hypothetical protein, partial [Sphingomonas sp. TF3]|uniref:hypothetical protein n=1 Tax=Sphingomonas sp. TF3 TaxID=2495580 RepID=UPI001C8E3C60